MAGKSEPGSLYLRLPVDYSVITGLVYMPDVDAIIVSTAEGSLLVYDAASFKRLFERSRRSGMEADSISAISTVVLVLNHAMCFCRDRGRIAVLSVPLPLRQTGGYQRRAPGSEEREKGSSVPAHHPADHRLSRGGGCIGGTPRGGRDDATV